MTCRSRLVIQNYVNKEEKLKVKIQEIKGGRGIKIQTRNKSTPTHAERMRKREA